jgi:hydrogenase nickel incorporation protein HypB
MCSTCGCGQPDEGFTLIIPNKNVVHHHDDHQLDHSHSHGPEHRQSHNHGNASPGSKTIVDLEQDILHKNNLLAERNRGYFKARDVLTLNLVSSPGSGKTSILERTLHDLKSEIRFSVIEGDQQSSRDADRIAKTGVPVIQINTGKTCHLDAHMVRHAFQKLPLEDKSILFIENVGNLVCPSLFDLGEKLRVVIMSVTEGEDKALKYPYMFDTSHLCIINKIDLLPYVEFDLEKAKSYAHQINPNLEFREVSATKQTGMESWYDWLKIELRKEHSDVSHTY